MASIGRTSVDAFLLTASLLLASQVSAVDQAEGTADGAPSQILSLPATVNQLSLPQLSPDELAGIEDSGGVTWSGIVRTISLNDRNHFFGTDGSGWSQTAVGPVWRLRLTSPHAKAMRVFVQDMDLGAGRLWIYADNDRMFGPYSGQGPYGDGEFWSSITLGSSVCIEFQPAIESASTRRVLSLPFRIARIGHLWHFPRALEDKHSESSRSSAILSKPSREASIPRAARAPGRWKMAQTTHDEVATGVLTLGRPNGFRLPPPPPPPPPLPAKHQRFT